MHGENRPKRVNRITQVECEQQFSCNANMKAPEHTEVESPKKLKRKSRKRLEDDAVAVEVERKNPGGGPKKGAGTS